MIRGYVMVVRASAAAVLLQFSRGPESISGKDGSDACNMAGVVVAVVTVAVIAIVVRFSAGRGALAHMLF